MVSGAVDVVEDEVIAVAAEVPVTPAVLLVAAVATKSRSETRHVSLRKQAYHSTSLR